MWQKEKIGKNSPEKKLICMDKISVVTILHLSPIPTHEMVIFAMSVWCIFSTIISPVLLRVSVLLLFFHSDAELKIKETEQIQQQTGKGCSTDAVCRTVTQCWNPGALTRTYPSFSMLCRLFPSCNSQHHPLRPPPALLNVVWAVTDKGHRPSEATQTIWCHTDHLTPHRPSDATGTGVAKLGKILDTGLWSCQFDS